MQENYGRDCEESIQAVKSLYKDLNLEQLFHEYEAQSYEELNLLIQSQDLLPRAVFTDLLQKIYKREK